MHTHAHIESHTFGHIDGLARAVTVGVHTQNGHFQSSKRQLGYSPGHWRENTVHHTYSAKTDQNMMSELRTLRLGMAELQNPHN